MRFQCCAASEPGLIIVEFVGTDQAIITVIGSSEEDAVDRC